MPRETVTICDQCRCRKGDCDKYDYGKAWLALEGIGHARDTVYLLRPHYFCSIDCLAKWGVTYGEVAKKLRKSLETNRVSPRGMFMDKEHEGVAI